MIHRCYYCHRVIWPWQASGWGYRFPRRFGKDWWHLRCRRDVEESKGSHPASGDHPFTPEKPRP